jgi:hypothetical protein
LVSGIPRREKISEREKIGHSLEEVIFELGCE